MYVPISVIADHIIVLPLDLKHSNFGSLYTASSDLECLLIISLIGIKGAQRRMMVALVLLLGPSLCPQLKPIRF